MGQAAELNSFEGRAKDAVRSSLSSSGSGAILVGVVGDGKEALALSEIRQAGASFWSIDLASASASLSEMQILAALGGALVRRSLPDTLADQDEWDADGSGELPKALLISGLDALSSLGMGKALDWGVKAAAMGATPIFMSNVPIDCDPPSGFRVAARGDAVSHGLRSEEAGVQEDLSEESDFDADEPEIPQRRARPGV